ncbi:lipase family protein [Jongsikchunia kroppenstedtii]|uniref:lipase family protein n=1 Tax=Jongsikchunia kroppenstedtii TaxID=1121721 RepID=UPI0003A90F1B|nr:lipase family protein [Jongsikchunia kroppenstedtii]
MSHLKRWAAGVVVTLCAILIVANPALAEAQPGFPPTFPSDQNQLPQLPSEPDIYHALPVPSPDRDPWYADPPNLAKLKPGTIIRTRVVQTRLLGIPVPVFSKQLLYRSNNVHMQPIATATTVIVPGIPWIGSPRPVISYQEAIDSTDSSCNPSHTLQAGTFKEIAELQYWLEQGFAINVPDFDGKFNTWITKDEGYMVLDSLRAMKNDRSLGLTDSGIGLYGFSGGGAGTLHTAEERKTYAPDVQIRAAAFGGVPANLPALVDYAARPEPGVTGISSFVLWPAITAMGREYPQELDPRRLLNSAGQQIVADMQHRCVYSEALTGMYRPISAYYAQGSLGVNDPQVRKVMAENSFGQKIPDIPLLWANGLWDELIPTSTILPVVHKYQRAGADLRYYTIPMVEHVANAIASWPPAVAWLSAVLRGLDPGPTFTVDYPAPLPAGFPGT